MTVTSKEKCPTWCVCSEQEDPREHHSHVVTRNGFRMELLRYFEDDITIVSLMEAMDGGNAVVMPVDTMISLVDEARLKVAA